MVYQKGAFQHILIKLLLRHRGYKEVHRTENWIFNSPMALKKSPHHIYIKLLLK